MVQKHHWHHHDESTTTPLKSKNNTDTITEAHWQHWHCCEHSNTTDMWQNTTNKNNQHNQTAYYKNTTDTIMTTQKHHWHDHEDKIKAVKSKKKKILHLKFYKNPLIPSQKHHWHRFENNNSTDITRSLLTPSWKDKNTTNQNKKKIHWHVTK